MQTHERHLFLLGPQPEYASLQDLLRELQLGSPLALITAGWETEENQDHVLKHSLGVDVINLSLFARTEKLFEEDPELIQLLRDRQDELRHLRDVYNDRLHLLAESGTANHSPRRNFGRFDRRTRVCNRHGASVGSAILRPDQPGSRPL